MEFLVDRFVKIWEEPALALFEEITTELNLALGQCIQGEFSQFKQLESAIRFDHFFIYFHNPR